MILCFHRDGASFPVKLEQYEGNKLFRVTCGLQVRAHLSYEQAARELGEALMHCLACEGKLDNGR